MFFFKTIISRFLKKTYSEDYRFLLFIFLAASVIFGIFISWYEDISLMDTYYYIITTATTVGYGDISPKTAIGKVFATVYMLLSITILGILMGKIAEHMISINEKIRRGLYKMDEGVDLLIVGYPNDDKMRELILELRGDDRFDDEVILNINHVIENKKRWMTEWDVYFVKGLASSQEVLQSANITNVKQALILASDISDVNSDDFSIATCAMIKKCNPDVHVIVEKVRQDATLFEIVGADIIVDASSSSLLAQEILDPGAIELGDAIFSNSTEGTQYNIQYLQEDTSWEQIAITVLKTGAIAEGFRNEGEKRFNLLPSLNDTVKKGALVKYRANNKLTTLEL